MYYIFDNTFVSNLSLIAILHLQKSCRLFVQLAIKYIIYTSADHLPWDTQLSHYDHIRGLFVQNRKGSLISRGCLIWRDTGTKMRGASNKNIHYDVTFLLTAVWRSHSGQIVWAAWINCELAREEEGGGGFWTHSTYTGYPGSAGCRQLDRWRWCYTRRQIHLYRMFFADFSVNSQPILMKLCKKYFRVTWRLPWNFHQKLLYSWKVRPSGM